MSINPMKWKLKTIGIIVVIFIFYVLFIHKYSHRTSIAGVVKNTHPTKVWEFVADFSNMKLLNSLIEDFNIIAESGNYDNWQYSVEYTEHLRYVPTIRNYGHGHYTIRQENQHYVIYSNHITCFFNLLCLNSTSKFRFEKEGENDTRCIEEVEYQCPISFMHLCDKEVTEQRREIMKRLIERFSGKLDSL